MLDVSDHLNDRHKAVSTATLRRLYLMFNWKSQKGDESVWQIIYWLSYHSQRACSDAGSTSFQVSRPVHWSKDAMMDERMDRYKPSGCTLDNPAFKVNKEEITLLFIVCCIDWSPKNLCQKQQKLLLVSEFITRRFLVQIVSDLNTFNHDGKKNNEK